MTRRIVPLRLEQAGPNVIAFSAGTRVWNVGGVTDAFMVSAKMTDIDLPARMADVLARLPDMLVSPLPELLPWNWKAAMELKRISG